MLPRFFMPGGRIFRGGARKSLPTRPSHAPAGRQCAAYSAAHPRSPSPSRCPTSLPGFRRFRRPLPTDLAPFSLSRRPSSAAFRASGSLSASRHRSGAPPSPPACLRFPPPQLPPLILGFLLQKASFSAVFPFGAKFVRLLPISRKIPAFKMPRRGSSCIAYFSFFRLLPTEPSSASS